MVFEVPVATNRVTTVSFPGPIAGIDAAGVTTDPETPALFQMAHAKGTAFFSVRALVSGAVANVNVRHAGSVYVFELRESRTPVLSLVMAQEDRPLAVQPRVRPDPLQLLALLDKAKSYPLLLAQVPDEVKGTEVRTFSSGESVSDFGDYLVVPEEAIRFGREDTLVFRLLLTNRTEAPIQLQTPSVRIGTRVFHPMIVESPGVIPPKGGSTMYLAITGTRDGGRAELSLDNDFRFRFERIMPSAIAADP